MIRITGHIRVKESVIVIALFFLLLHSAMGQSLKISSGTKFIATDGNVVLKGNLVNDGSFINDSSTIIFAGTAQSLEGTLPVIFNNLTVASGSTTTITTTGQSLKGVLLSNGTLNADGKITLLSTAAQTALIDGSGTGQVYGNVTMQRYLPAGFGYKYFSSPFQAANVSEFGDEIFLGAAFPPFYRYDEAKVSSGWVTYSNPDSVLRVMKGYAANFGAAGTAITVDATGVVSNGILSSTLYNHNNAYTKGFNLAGNPYPSPIDWNAPSGWTKTKIDDALYFFKASGDQYSGTYSTFINGFSNDGEVSRNIIPSMQAFFIHVSNGTFPVTGTLEMDNRVRVTNLSRQFVKGDSGSDISFLRLITYYTDLPASYDPIVIYFDEKAQKEFDSGLDALKLMNTDQQVPNLYSVAADGYNLSINALPVMNDSLVVVPLGLKTARNGIITFKIRDTINLPSETQIFLRDNVAGTDQILDQNNEYNIYLNSGEFINRFSLRFIKGTTNIPENKVVTSLFDIYNLNGTLVADIIFLPGQRATLMISNISGQLLFRKEIYQAGYQEFYPQLKPGIYFVTCISGNISDTKKILIINR